MNLPTAEEITVTAGYNTLDDACASWETPEARFHVWIRPETGRVKGPLFKNPPLGADRYSKGYFHTRRLEPTAKANAPVVAHVQKIVRDGDLIAKAWVRKQGDALAERVAKLKAEAEAVRAALRREAAGCMSSNPKLCDALITASEACDETLISLRRSIFHATA